jgi:TfoX/Sxy family transcriptional regulator of competence genes
MASDVDFVNYVMDQINDVGIITSKKMFGEYMVYVNQKPVILICNNTAYVKMLDCIKPFLENSETDFPYKGAKEHYILDIDNKETLVEIIKEVEKIATVPKKKNKKKTA